MVDSSALMYYYRHVTYFEFGLAEEHRPSRRSCEAIDASLPCRLRGTGEGWLSRRTNKYPPYLLSGLEGFRSPSLLNTQAGHILITAAYSLSQPAKPSQTTAARQHAQQCITTNSSRLISTNSTVTSHTRRMPATSGWRDDRQHSATFSTART